MGVGAVSGHRSSSLLGWQLSGNFRVEQEVEVLLDVLSNLFKVAGFGVEVDSELFEQVFGGQV